LDGKARHPRLTDVQTQSAATMKFMQGGHECCTHSRIEERGKGMVEV